MIGSILSGVLISLMLWFFARSASQAPALEEGGFVVAYPDAFNWMGALLLIFGAGTTGFLWLSFGIQSRSDLIGLATFLAMMVLLALPFFLEARRRVKVGTQGLEGHLIGAPTQIAWRELSEVRFSRWSGCLTLVSERGTKIRVSAFMRGGPHLADLLQTHPDVSGVDEALAAFRAYRSRYGM